MSGKISAVANTTSKNDTFQVLLLEDDPISQAFISKAILRAASDTTILLAPSLAEGRRLLGEHSPGLCVLDIQLPDGSGLDFLYDIQDRVPDARVIILTGVPLPQHRDQAEAFGVLHFMEKPVDSRALGEVVRGQRDKWLTARAGNRGGFSALLTQLTTLDIIQIKCIVRATVALEFTGDHGRQGKLYFKDGEVLHAETGAISGVDAFNEIVGWRGGQVIEIAGGPTPSRTIEGNWQTLLMNAVHWVDEQKQD